MKIHIHKIWQLATASRINYRPASEDDGKVLKHALTTAIPGLQIAEGDDEGIPGNRYLLIQLEGEAVPDIQIREILQNTNQVEYVSSQSE